MGFISTRIAFRDEKTMRTLSDMLLFHSNYNFITFCSTKNVVRPTSNPTRVFCG